MMLTSERRKQMRAIGHHLKPIVLIGDNGMSPGLLEELHRALEDHELIKVKVRADRNARKILIASLCKETGAYCVQSTGATALLFRAAERPNPRLSNLIRPM
ncbi:MAG TPA: ribosome assembly RNA-binding protein YhbY [Gammaproteobacteria bacterium]|nr:ribosome assembly RNA-binding protein YhbY [Gammaproteobacteria bacterium]HBX26325.1 ribosome assembly RNA-binding protein YhbY [Gammaproteobacteria bacterium]